jgi:hypothetical protein
MLNTATNFIMCGEIESEKKPSMNSARDLCGLECSKRLHWQRYQTQQCENSKIKIPVVILAVSKRHRSGLAAQNTAAVYQCLPSHKTRAPVYLKATAL